MKKLLFVTALMLLTACQALNGSGSPGYIERGESLYDGSRFAKLIPGSLFDADNTPSVFRVGLIWDERYGDNLHLIVTVPMGKTVSISELSKSTDRLKVKIAGKEMSLRRVKGSITIQEVNTMNKEYEANIKYKITRQTLESMLASKRVVFRLHAANKSYAGNLYVSTGVQNRYKDVDYTAISGIKRFYKEIWGKQKK